jgi:hypothetical protein
VVQGGGSQTGGTSRVRLQDDIKMELVEPICEVCGLGSAISSGSNDFCLKTVMKLKKAGNF